MHILILVASICLKFFSANGDHQDHLEVTVSDLKNTVSNIAEVLVTVQSSINGMERRLADLEKKGCQSLHTNLSPDQYEFGTFGCQGDVIPLSCDGGRTIHVNSARFGMYYVPCNDQCCLPHYGFDCFESVEESRPQDWVALLYLCENQTSCEYEYLGSLIESCEPDYFADYMSIYFTCLPEDSSAPIGFLVCHINGDHEYVQHDVIRYGTTLTNVGGGFQEDMHTFICPRDGMYMFSISTQTVPNKLSRLRLKQNNEFTIQAWADSTTGGRGQASSVAILECNKGDDIYVDAGAASSVHGDNCRTTFSGYLLYAYYFLNIV